ncbi:PREDICTED: uncharacterized protein LOC109328381 isoform X3 [Lupinus angustifolius]|uniref:uncharacterized protein LOC109328381 isoform X3 n=1 Tax=Lupinus angustifolius TaxID=3871 RepID=UPI00092EFED7|nr:PREDICTED: uncharacterized protein LOC109328381 isoform X3 [Lupinus angustifolius]
MATLSSTAHVSKKPFPHSSEAKRLSVKCAVSPTTWQESRRIVSISIALSHFLLIPNRAAAEGSMLDKKKLDPLEAYVPAVILTQFQIKDLEKTLEGDEPQFSLCRSLLRSGPAASLRVNIRAVAQYASDSGNGKTAFNSVDDCLRSLEDLDNLLLRASRNDPGASVKSMKAKIGSTLNALDSLLQTVPPDVLSRGKVIADSYREPEDVETQSLDPELKQLESIL